jgi:hypothetical protein
MNDIPAARTVGNGRPNGARYVYAPQVIHPIADGCREPETLDWRPTYDAAAELGAVYAHNTGHRATFRVLRREIGPWQECAS